MTKTMCGADCWTDDRVVVSELNLNIQSARRPQGKKSHQNVICNHFGAMTLSSEDPKENWTVFSKFFHSSAATTLGNPSRKHQDCFDDNDEEIQRLL